ncbi:major capsid protein [uncultured Caudovirales phage]|uniref:Major capsid protein n=1 Tax=uncultured Caudovirales phage TaxID=2100421 RepID=A0A6J5KXF3_9CAUD|nr:major capsid protein [uncultured Caudovirales phage]
MELNRSALLEKWAPVIDAEGGTTIKDSTRRGDLAVILENQQREMGRAHEATNMLFETAPTNSGSSAGLNAISTSGYSATSSTSGVAGFDPVLINLVRRAMPQLIAYDVAGVQPMTQPTGLIFAMKSRYTTQAGTEALYNEAKGGFSAGTAVATDGYSDPTDTANYTAGRGMATSDAETLGSGSTFPEMAFSIEKTSVVAKTRALKAEYSIELAQDLKSVHGLDAEGELSKILSTEILAEINREVIRTIYTTAYRGATNGTATAGTFDLDVDSNGRWSVEKFKGLLFQIEREANAIAQLTRRGRGNFVICSSDVASALAMAGVLDYAPALSTGLNVDEASTTFAGILNGKYKVYVDPYAGGQNLNSAGNPSGSQFFTVGYKGTSAFDAGLFYCPYVPLQLVRAVDPLTFQPKIGFKTRYGLVANPMVDLDDGSASASLTANKNYYYRFCKVTNLM